MAIRIVLEIQDGPMGGDRARVPESGSFRVGRSQSMDLSLGEETWEDARTRLLPLIKPRSYVDSDS